MWMSEFSYPINQCLYCGNLIPATNLFCHNPCLRQFILGRRGKYEGEKLLSRIRSHEASWYRTVTGAQRKLALSLLLQKGREAADTWAVDHRVYLGQKWVNCPLWCENEQRDYFIAVLMPDINFEAYNAAAHSAALTQRNNLLWTRRIQVVEILPSVVLINNGMVTSILNGISAGVREEAGEETEGVVVARIYGPDYEAKTLMMSREEAGEPLPLPTTLTNAVAGNYGRPGRKKRHEVPLSRSSGV